VTPVMVAVTPREIPAPISQNRCGAWDRRPEIRRIEKIRNPGLTIPKTKI
jgi:hypothetical protein